MVFQSLGRDSVHSSPAHPTENPASVRVSIPRSGFCSFKPCPTSARIAPSSGFNPSVGILFIQAAARMICWKHPDWSFNPSVGILFIQAWGLPSPCSSGSLFQSLGRDSVHSSVATVPIQPILSAVSIPRSGFCSFKLWPRAIVGGLGRKFQSLGRDSVHSSIATLERRKEDAEVSIPRSGFCSFKHYYWTGCYRTPGQVSIPRSGFCSFKQQRPTHVPPVAVVSIPRSGFCSFKLKHRDRVGEF